MALSPLKLTLRSSVGIMRRACREGDANKRDGLMVDGISGAVAILGP